MVPSPDNVTRGRRGRAGLAANILGFVFLRHLGESHVKMVSKQLEKRI